MTAPPEGAAALGKREPYRLCLGMRYDGTMLIVGRVSHRMMSLRCTVRDA